MIISKTPLRISFAGGGTDLPSFYRANGYGAVVSTSIDSYIYVVVKRHEKVFDERIRLNYSEVELVNDIDDIKNLIIRECLRFLDVDDRIYIATIADAPGASGLGSSSAFCVGLLNALYKFKGLSTSAGRLAEEAAHIEIDVLGKPIGKQDHYATAYGGLNYIRFNADETVTIQPIVAGSGVTNRLFECLLSFWTRQSRPAESVLSEQDRNSGRNTETLLRMRAQAEELVGLLKGRTLDIQRFGALLHEGWLMKRGLASQISNARIDQGYEAARRAGAIGGKVSGAGGGGFLSVVAEKVHHGAIIEAVEARDMVSYKFSSDSLGTVVSSLA